MYSDAGAWLHQALLRLQEDSSLAYPFEVNSLVAYCESASPSDAQEFLINMIGKENGKEIAAEYCYRCEAIGGHSPEVHATEVEHLQVYVKPQMDENWPSGSKKTAKSSKSRSATLELKSNVEAVDGSPGQRLKVKNGGSRVKKGAKGISLADAAEGRVLIPRGAPCNCQATRHKLVNNCLSCGRIVCEQEGEGPCNFCGALVLREGSTYAGLDGDNVPVSEAEAAARAFKNRLVEYGRTSSQRTTVIDDQSDYFQIDENTWLSQEEKQALRRQQQELEEAEEARKKKVVVTIDLLGRKVVMADELVSSVNLGASILEGKALDKRSSDVRIKPNPSVSESPVFLDATQSKEIKFANSSTQARKMQKNLLPSEMLTRSGRVQHDDPLVCALESSTLVSHEQKDAERTGNIKERVDGCSFEDDDDAMECNWMTSPVFDICEHEIDGSNKRFSLSPSLLQDKQIQRKMSRDGTSETVKSLRKGMFLLKGWLTQENQVEIVKTCRDLGVGSGGFYQPTYGDDSKMHLWMMCLGMHWEPTTRSYEARRSRVDNATPPAIPAFFLRLVDECLRAAQAASSKSADIPAMNPNICLVNFYGKNGRLGMHQDRDESPESLARGAPVVSFSIGDSAEFVFGVDRDTDKAERVVLGSGDVLVFGGPARMIFHGVSRIYPQTAPPWLRHTTKLRPGRINLTFREL